MGSRIALGSAGRCVWKCAEVAIGPWAEQPLRADDWSRLRAGVRTATELPPRARSLPRIAACRCLREMSAADILRVLGLVHRMPRGGDVELGHTATARTATPAILERGPGAASPRTHAVSRAAQFSERGRHVHQQHFSFR